MATLSLLQEQHLEAVARLHASALYGDFLPSLGEKFLGVFYGTVIKKGLGFGFVNLENDYPIGFVLGSADTTRLFRQTILAAGPALAWAAIPACLRRPALLLKAAETLFYPQREAAVPEQAELLVIAVEAAHRSQGIGEQLVGALDGVFSSMGVKSYKVTVLQANGGANKFYQRLDFRLAGQFRLYGRAWNLYLRTLSEAACESIDHPSHLSGTG